MPLQRLLERFFVEILIVPLVIGLDSLMITRKLRYFLINKRAGEKKLFSKSKRLVDCGASRGIIRHAVLINQIRSYIQQVIGFSLVWRRV